MGSVAVATIRDDAHCCLLFTKQVCFYTFICASPDVIAID